jgi:O-succinylbenzoic acid--CoA ligase
VRFIAGKMMIVRAIEGKLNLHAAPPTTHPLRGIPGKFKFAAMIPLQIITSLKEDNSELERIDHLIIGGAALSPEIRKILASRKQHYYETYGMTETATHVAVRRISKNNTASFEALPGISFSLNKSDCLVVEAKGEHAFRIETNDMVNLKSATSFEWLGRIDHVINSGGIKIHPEIVEEKLSSIIKHRFFILGVEDEKLGQKVVLIIEGNAMISNELENFKQQLSGILQKFEIPKEIHFVPRLPETPNHKIIRKWPL